MKGELIVKSLLKAIVPLFEKLWKLIACVRQRKKIGYGIGCLWNVIPVIGGKSSEWR